MLGYLVSGPDRRFNGGMSPTRCAEPPRAWPVDSRAPVQTCRSERNGVRLHRDEEDRLRSLTSYRILDTAPERAYDAAAVMAAAACGTAGAMVTLVDRDRQWFKAVAGSMRMGRETPRSDSFCSDVVAASTELVVPDALADPRHASKRVVTGAPWVRAYAGVPLVSRDGVPLGALCVVDPQPRSFTWHQLQQLGELASVVVAHLELRRTDLEGGRDPSALVPDALDPLRLRSAIEQGDVRPWFQPVVDMANGSVLAFEALARWHHPVAGILAPASFLPAAERTGLMDVLHRKVLADATGLVADLRSRSGTGSVPHVAVNVSGREVGERGFASAIEEALARRGLVGSDLCVELTESVPVDCDVAASELRQLRQLGVGVALDDYGAGVAATGRLLELPISVLKIDRTLTHAAASSARGRAVVRATLQMADEIGIDVVCEGVETPEQRDVLLELGARRGQGWLFGAPAPRGEVDRYLRGPLV